MTKQITDRYLALFGAFLFLLPVVIHFSTVVRYYENIPLWDDYHSALQFLNQFLQLETFTQRIQHIVSQHNEHRMVPNRLMTILTYYILGRVDFKIAILVSNLVLVLLAVGLLHKEFRVPGLQKCLLALAVSLFIFQPQYGDGMVWTTTVVQSFSVTFLALLTFALLERAEGRWFWWALCCALLAMYTQGNGLLVPVLGLGVLVITRQYRRAVAWVLLSTGMIGIFFVNYRTTARSYEGTPLDHIELVVEFFFTFLGSSWGFSSPIFSVLSGFTLLGLCVLLTWRGYAKRNPSLFMFVLFLLGSAFLAAISRGPTGANWALSPGRYTVVSTVLTSTLAVAFHELMANGTRLRTVYGLALVMVAGIFNIFSYRHYEEPLARLQNRMVLDLVLWTSNEGGLTFPWPDQSDQIMRDALSTGIYQIGQAGIGAAAPSLGAQQLVDGKRKIVGRINRVRIGPEFALLEGWAFLKRVASTDTVTYVMLQNAKERLFYSTKVMARGDVAGQFPGIDRDQSGFILLIPISQLTTERYKVSLVLEHEGTFYLKELKATLDLIGASNVS